MVLEIVISGLVAFARESCEVKNAKIMHIVMVKGDMQVHRPRLVVEIEDVLPTEANDAQPDEIIDLPDNSQWAVWNLNGKEIEVYGAPKIQIVEGERQLVEGTSDYLNSYPTQTVGKEDSPNDFSWSPELHRACLLSVDTGQKEKDRRAKAKVTKPGKLDGFAVARFAPLFVDPTTGGKDNVLKAELDGQSADDVFDFPGVDNYKQVLADRARLKMTFDKGPIEIRLHPAGSKTYKTIRLMPRPQAGNVAVSVSNLPSHKGKPSTEVEHFHEYYKLLDYTGYKKCPTPRNKKFVQPTNDDPETTSVKPTKCTICSVCGPPETK